MTIWGVGPRLALLSFAYSLIPFLLMHLYPEYFIISFVPQSFFKMAGIILLAIGIPFWAVSVMTIVKGFKKGVLCTRGVYSIVRHPLYCAFIVFIVPGILMFFRSWVLFTIPIASYLIFKRLIGKEEQYLAETFGEEYQRYKTRVHAILPVPKSLTRTSRK
jgi:protein-S-isoprenylcysteine O-methyltransferase Ste14